MTTRVRSRPAVHRRPVVLSIAGSDSSAGAGAQADLKTFSYFGCYGLTAVTCVVAEVPGKVSAIQAMRPEIVAEQISLSFSAFPVAVAKTGMLFSSAIVEAVADALAGRGKRLVVDPVMVASSGAKLLQNDAVEALVSRLFPLATVVTPNLDEAEARVGPGSSRELAVRLHDLGAPAVIVTGGHGDDPVDHLFDGADHVEIEFERHEVAATHGAGCTHSATLTALLARGQTLQEAARGAAATASAAVAHGLTEIGHGEGPVDVLDLNGAA